MNAQTVAHRRRQWTGKPLVYSDGKIDEEFAECPSCLGFHAASNLACNGKREPWPDRCKVCIPSYSAGLMQCDRPANHLGDHDLITEGARIRWTILHPADPEPGQP